MTTGCPRRKLAEYHSRRLRIRSAFGRARILAEADRHAAAMALLRDALPLLEGQDATDARAHIESSKVAIANRDVAVKEAQLRHINALARLSGFADAPDSREAYEELVQHGLSTERELSFRVSALEWALNPPHSKISCPSSRTSESHNRPNSNRSATPPPPCSGHSSRPSSRPASARSERARLGAAFEAAAGASSVFLC